MRGLSRESRALGPLTAQHLLTDACSAGLFVWASDASWHAFLYNFVAFALQLPLGWALDARPWPLRPLLAVSAALLLAGVALFGATGEPAVSIALACAGNALFHVAAGKRLVEEGGGRVARVGLFISTGAIGLFLGLRFGAAHPFGTVGGALAGFMLCLLLFWRMLAERPDAPSVARPLTSRPRPLEILAVLLLSALVVWRSHGVLSATRTFSAVHQALLLGCALTFCSWLGQSLGGVLADRWGRFRTLGLSLVGSMALFLLTPYSGIWGWLLLMFLAQLATGPVLALLFSACGGRGGLACGVNACALFLSTLFFCWPERALHYFSVDWLAIALEFAATAWVRLPHWFLALACVNMLTHPALTYAVHRIGYSMPVVASGELLVVLVEGAVLALLYRGRAPGWRMFLVAAWMNAVSYATGVLLFGW